MAEQKTTYFEGLDFLRFISAFVLIFYHVSLGWKQAPMFKTLVNNMLLGVDMFFIISGFLITYFLIEEKKSEQGISIKNFYIKRVLRIFPLYFFIIITSYIFFYNPNVDFVKYSFFIGNFWQIEIAQWAPIDSMVALWSLCIEEQFYLVIPFLIWIVPFKKIPHLIIFLILLCLSFRGWVILTYPADNYWMTIYNHTLSRSDALLIGSLIAYYHSAYHFKVHFNRYIIGAIFFNLLIVMAIVESTDYSGLLNAVFKKYIYIIPFTLLLLGIVLNTDENQKTLNWLKSNRVLSYLGKISFGIYMYQSYAGHFVKQVPILHCSFLMSLISVSITTIIISVISYELFEKRIISLKRFFIKTEVSSAK